MQIYQPFDLCLGLFVGSIGLLSIVFSVFRLSKPLSRTNRKLTRLNLVSGPSLLFLSAARVSRALEPHGHLSLHTLVLEIISVSGVVAVITIFVSLIRADLRSDKRRRTALEINRGISSLQTSTTAMVERTDP